MLRLLQRRLRRMAGTVVIQQIACHALLEHSRLHTRCPHQGQHEQKYEAEDENGTPLPR